MKYIGKTRVYVFRGGDYLMVYDGNSNLAEMIGKYCGHSIPPSFISSSNEMFLHFLTDGWDTQLGYKIQYNRSGKFPSINAIVCSALSW